MNNLLLMLIVFIKGFASLGVEVIALRRLVGVVSRNPRKFRHPNSTFNLQVS